MRSLSTKRPFIISLNASQLFSRQGMMHIRETTLFYTVQWLVRYVLLCSFIKFIEYSGPTMTFGVSDSIQSQFCNTVG